jgi:deoxyribodipyrimidine photo-lyase
MQAATTGINTIRIYNPVYNWKQKDTEWKFIYQYMPELKWVPVDFIHEPHLWDWFESLNYPLPIVDIKEANKNAKDILWKIKWNSSSEIKNKIIKKHASRTFHWDRALSKKAQATKSWKQSEVTNQTKLF